MNKRIDKILIICRSFYPEISPRSFRATELAKEFVRQGFDVSVLTRKQTFDYTDFLERYPLRFFNFRRLRLMPFKTSSWKWIGDLPRKFGRLLYLLFNYPDIELVWRVKQALQHQDGFDLVISIAVPHSIHWGTAWARKRDHKIGQIWVADCGDPYYLNTLESIKPPFYFAWLEKWFCKKADFIAIPFKDLANYFFSEFHQKIRVIPQGFNFDDIKIDKREPVNIKPTFAYAGGIAKSGVRSPMSLIKILMNFEEDFEFHLFASTGYELVSMLGEKSDYRIVVHKAVPREMLIPELSKMDFLINLYIKGTEAKQVPSKLIDYALAGRPILNIDPINPDENTLKKFIMRDYQDAFTINGIQNYNIKNVAMQFIDLVAPNIKDRSAIK